MIDLTAHQNSLRIRSTKISNLVRTSTFWHFHGLWLFHSIVCSSIRFSFVTYRKTTFNQRGSLEFMGYKRARELQCPVCKGMVFQHELVKHLIVDHDVEPFEAGEMTGKVMENLVEEE